MSFLHLKYLLQAINHIGFLTRIHFCKLDLTEFAWEIYSVLGKKWRYVHKRYWWTFFLSLFLLLFLSGKWSASWIYTFFKCSGKDVTRRKSWRGMRFKFWWTVSVFVYFINIFFFIWKAKPWWQFPFFILGRYVSLLFLITICFRSSDNFAFSTM